MPKTSVIGRGGFTLVELMVVLAIVVMIAAAMPLVLNRALPARRVAVASDQLIADVRWLQTQSMLLGRPVAIRVTESGYRLDLSSGKSKDVIITKPMSVKLHSRENDRIVNELLVYPDGTSSAGRFEISDSGRRATVEISLLTGRARRAS